MDANTEFTLKVLFITYLYTNLPEIWIYTLPIWIIVFHNNYKSAPKTEKTFTFGNARKTRNTRSRKIRVHTGKKA